MSNKTFQHTGSLRPGRSVFDLSYEKKFSADMGFLYPIMCDEVVPGDTFVIGNECIARMMPLVAPILHEINVYTHYFFVPYRLLWSHWEDFITGGVDGSYEASLPRWTGLVSTNPGDLYDMLGFPPEHITNTGIAPLDFPRRAYNLVWNEFYRDETFQTAIEVDAPSTAAGQNSDLLRRNWEKDYFTSALPWQQRGTAPALPITGTGHAIFNFEDWPIWAPLRYNRDTDSNVGATRDENSVYLTSLRQNPKVDAELAYGALESQVNLGHVLSDNEIDLGDAITFNATDIRTCFQIQKWLERNARAGSRYIEFLGAHFGVHPRDERLQKTGIYWWIKNTHGYF